MKKLNFLLTFIFTLVFLLPRVSAEDTSITLTSKVSGVKQPVTNTYTYTITKEGTNPSGSSNEPTTFEVAFENEKQVDNVSTKEYKIDFKNTSYTKPGLYEYQISETNSSNETEYPLSEETYKIRVLVTYDEEDNLVVQVHPQVLNENNEKTDLIFNHITNKEEPTPSESEIPSEKDENKKNPIVPKTGIFVNYLPFVILILISIVGILVIVKTKDKNEK